MQKSRERNLKTDGKKVWEFVMESYGQKLFHGDLMVSVDQMDLMVSVAQTIAYPLSEDSIVDCHTGIAEALGDQATMHSSCQTYERDWNLNDP